MSQTISNKTLFPLSFVGMIIAGSFFVAQANSKVEVTEKRVEKLEATIESHISVNSKSYIEIIQRLTRIEEAVKK